MFYLILENWFISNNSNMTRLQAREENTGVEVSCIRTFKQSNSKMKSNNTRTILNNCISNKA